MGLDPGNPGSPPGPKAGAQLLSHPAIPPHTIFLKKIKSKSLKPNVTLKWHRHQNQLEIYKFYPNLRLSRRASLFMEKALPAQNLSFPLCKACLPFLYKETEVCGKLSNLPKITIATKSPNEGRKKEREERRKEGWPSRWPDCDTEQALSKVPQGYNSTLFPCPVILSFKIVMIP